MKKNMSKKVRIIRKSIGLAIAILLASGGIVAAVIITRAPDIQDVNVRPEGYLTTILDDEGNVTRTLAGSEANRVYATLDQIPVSLQQAFVAIEDARFYTHHGVDVKGVARAVAKGVTSGHFSQGASTITQQLIKNNVFDSWMEEDSFADRATRKIQEQYLAIRLEQIHSKEWILENYLNTINLGGGSWGVEAASRRYFGKSVSDLNIPESAMLAGITKNPSAYNPLNHPEAAKERQKLVLDAMKEQGYLSEAEYEEASRFDVLADIEANHSDLNDVPFSYFEDALLESICDALVTEEAMTEEAAWDLIYRGGLTIYSTEDVALQNICESVATNDEYFPDEGQVSIVIMENETGKVKALIGGRGTKDSSLVYNRAVESVRQPGSAIKIIGEYAACLDQNLITLGTTMDDAKTQYSNGTEMNSGNGKYGGQTTIRSAIAKSLNTVALKCYQKAGADSVFFYLQSFGITTLDEKDNNESLAIGGTYHGVTNLELTAAYQTIANLGTYMEPHYFTKVLDHDGNVLLTKEVETHQVVSEETAMLLTTAMEDVLISGTGTSADFNGIPLAGKTGTTNMNKDAWFVGYSPYYTCGVWGGFDDNREQSSAGYVKTIWKTIMKEASAGCTWKDFEGRNLLVTAEICTKCGKLAEEGRCDVTLQGDMTKVESYAPGTAPTSYCDCHQKVILCKETGKIANSYCPENQTETVVYLKKGTQGTADENYVMPDDLGTCDTHVSVWEQWFGNPDNQWGQDDAEGAETPQEQSPEEEKTDTWNFWDYWHF